jgi:hypothetical protein
MLERLRLSGRRDERNETSNNVTTRDRRSTKSSVTAIGFASVFALLFLAAVPFALWGLKKAGVYPAEIALAVVLIAAAAALIIVISMLTVVFNRLQISDSDEAMVFPREVSGPLLPYCLSSSFSSQRSIFTQASRKGLPLGQRVR